MTRRLLALALGASSTGMLIAIFGTAFGAGFPDALNGVHGPVTITVKGTGMRALAVLVSPLAYLVYVIWIRFHFETLVVLFCIAENTASLADAGRAQSRRRGQGDRG